MLTHSIGLVFFRGEGSNVVLYKNVALIPLVRPAGRLMSAMECKLRRDAWNKCVDEYIEKGVDTRSREEIELTVKLGINLGAYLPKCERKGCPNRAAWKDRDSIKFRRCGKCKCVNYFSFTLILLYV
jgi:hypothetical protein